MSEYIPRPCTDWAEKIAATHPNDLSAFERKALSKHLESCSVCATTLANYSMVDIQLRSTSGVEPLPGLPPQLLQIWKKQDYQRMESKQTFVPFFYALLAYGLMIIGIGIYAIYRNILHMPIWVLIIAIVTIIFITAGLFATTSSTHSKDLRYKRQSSPQLERYRIILFAFVLSFVTSVPLLLSYLAYTAPTSVASPGSTSSQNWKPTLSNSLSSPVGSCSFNNGSYDIKGSSPACYSTKSFSNFAFEVQMKIINGDTGGILFRANPEQQRSYYFAISQSGNYRVYIDAYSNFSYLLKDGSSLAIKTGLDQYNQIGVVAIGESIDFYVNRQKVDNVSNSLYRDGKIGLAADGLSSNEILFSDVQVWELG